MTWLTLPRGVRIHADRAGGHTAEARKVVGDNGKRASGALDALVGSGTKAPDAIVAPGIAPQAICAAR